MKIFLHALAIGITDLEITYKVNHIYIAYYSWIDTSNYAAIWFTMSVFYHMNVNHQDTGYNILVNC